MHSVALRYFQDGDNAPRAGTWLDMSNTQPMVNGTGHSYVVRLLQKLLYHGAVVLAVCSVPSEAAVQSIHNMDCKSTQFRMLTRV